VTEDVGFSPTSSNTLLPRAFGIARKHIERTKLTVPEDKLELYGNVAMEALRSYQLPEKVTVTLINDSENETYKVEAPESCMQWALRIHRLGYHSRNAIASEIAWLMALRKDHVVATQVPVNGRNGEFIQTFGHSSPMGPRYAVLFDWEKGDHPDVQKDLRQSFEMLGAITAKMNLHSKSWKRPPGFERLTWNYETSLGSTSHWGRWSDGIGMDAEKLILFGKTAELIKHRLARYGSGADRFGLIHCDLRLANLIFHEGQVKVIDFDDCGFGWYMYDAATPLSFYEHLPKATGLIEHWLRGYRSVSELCKADEEEIPTFIMLRRLVLVAWVGSHSQTDLARTMGAEFTHQTVNLCESYLTRFG
jgi:Ser/Thr protein kinase RdoA (MazF antagonist)